MVEVLADHSVAARLVDDLDDEGLSAATAHAGASDGVVRVAQGCLQHGLVAESLNLVLLTGDDLTSQQAAGRDSRRMPSRRRRQIDPLELRAGDYVVHEQHGVGRYVEMIQRTVAGATREYVLIEYAASRRGQPPDRLFVPTDQLDQVTRYVGGEQPVARPARRLRLDQAQGPGPQGRSPDRG